MTWVIINYMVDFADTSRVYQRFIHNTSEKSPVFVSHTVRRRSGSSVFDMHPEMEIGIVLSGKATRYWGNYTRKLVKGDVWLCGMWEPHGRIVTEPPFRTVTCAIHHSFFYSMKIPETPWLNLGYPFLVPADQRPWTKTADRPWFSRMGRRIASWRLSKDRQRQAWLRLLVTEALLKLAGNDMDRLKKIASTSKSNFSKISSAIELVLDSHSFIPVHKAARACGMHITMFRRIFEDTMQVSFPDFALHYRLKRALEMVSDDKELIKTAIIEWGFTDYSHFSRCFKKFYNTTLSRYLETSRL